MIVTDQNQADLGEFERESQKLLLDIAMEASNREMHGMVASRQKPANLSGYYRSLQTWRAPVLHQVDAQNKPSSLHDGTRSTSQKGRSTGQIGRCAHLS